MSFYTEHHFKGGFRMNYQSFKENVMPKIEELVRQKGYEVSRIHLHKTNVEKEAIIIREKSRQTAPNVYLDYIFENYQNFLDEFVNSLLSWINYTESDGLEKIGDLFSKDFILENVTVALLNAERNKKLLVDVPHEKFLDLAIVYRVIVSQDENGTRSILVKNDHMLQYGVTEDELHGTALSNSYDKSPYQINSMDEIIKGLLGSDELLEHDVELNNSSSEPMLVITNKFGVDGSSAILNNLVLKSIGDRLGGDFFVLPSSRHEVIAVPALEKSKSEVAKFKEMVTDINADMVVPTDFLSDEVYYCDYALGELYNATEYFKTDKCRQKSLLAERSS